MNLVATSQTWTARVAVTALAMALTGCAGMSVPYDSEPYERKDDIKVTTLTPELVAQLRKTPVAETEELPVTQAAGKPYSYVIKPGDILLISVPSIVTYNTPGATIMGGESGQGYTVYEDGTIYLPFGGSVKVAGLTQRQVQDQVVSALSKYLKTPQVVVGVRDFRSQRIMVTGQVEKPGYQPVTDVPLTLLGAISAAGGVALRRGRDDPRAIGGASTAQAAVVEYPDLSHVALKREGTAYVIDVEKLLASGDTKRDVQLKDGDVVVVPAARRSNVFVLGEVLRPALVEIDREHTDLAQVLMATGGLNQLSANPRRVYVIRGDFTGPTIYQLNSKNPDGLLLAQQFQVEPQDVIYVAEAPVGRWNRTLTQILPTLQGLLSTAVIVNTVDNLSGK